LTIYPTARVSIYSILFRKIKITAHDSTFLHYSHSVNSGLMLEQSAIIEVFAIESRMGTNLTYMTRYIIVGTMGVVLGFITSYVFYRIQKRRRELCWSIASTILIKSYSSLFESLEIEYGEQKIENMTVSKIVFWNNGNETIDHADIAIHPHIWPRLEDTKILDTRVITSSTIGNDFHAEIIEKDIQLIALSFDYLDPQQGAVIQVIHTGVSLAPLLVGGEIKGVQKIEYKSKRLDFGSQMPRLFIYLAAVTVFAFLGLSIYRFGSLRDALASDSSLWLLVIVSPVTIFLVIYDIRTAIGTAKIPKNLSVFDKDDLQIKRTG
jgi:hypothetical protein